jgi:WD40 repeat protein
VASSKSLISTYFRQKFPAVLQIDVDMDEEPQPVLTAAISGNMLAVIISNSSLKVFDLSQEGEEVFHAAIDPIPLKRDGRDVGYCLGISRNQTMVALGRIGCDIWRLADSTRRLPLPATQVAEVHITGLAFSDDGEHIVAGFDDGALREWVVDSGMEGRRFAWPDSDGVDDLKSRHVITVVYAQTDDRIISGCWMSSGPTRFFIWSRSGDCTFSYLLSDNSYYISISFARWLISAHDVEDSTRQWQIQDLLTGESKSEYYPQPQPYREWTLINDWHWFYSSTSILAISSDGNLAALGSNLSIFIWDVHENSQLVELVGHSDRLTSVTFAESHGDSKYRLVSTSHDGTIRLWDLDQLFKPKEDQHPMTSWGLCPKADEYSWLGGAWIQNGKGECLFWLPRSCPIRHPLNTLVIGRCAELDMTNFVYGEEWTKCRGSNVDDEPSDAERLM